MLYAISIPAPVWPYYVPEPLLIRGVIVTVAAWTDLLLVGPALESANLAPRNRRALQLLAQMPAGTTYTIC